MALGLGVAAASLLSRVAVGMSQPYSRYELTPCRLDGFALGGLVAAAVRDEVWLPIVARFWKPVVGLAAAGFVVVVIHDHQLEPTSPAISLVGYSLLALGFSALVAGCAIEDHLAKYPLLTSFGRYSYAIYLLHFPLSVVLEPYYGTQSILVATAWLVGSIAVSWLMGFVSWHVLEKYPLMLKRFFKPRYALEPADLGAT
jgi:peptidoglycan/LPS O-acetylase OafA/YrhL